MPRQAAPLTLSASPPIKMAYVAAMQRYGSDLASYGSEFSAVLASAKVSQSTSLPLHETSRRVTGTIL